MGLFQRDHTKGINQQPADVSIDVKSDRIILQAKRGGNVAPGDTLLVSYKTERTGWARVEILYPDSRKGIELFTAGKADQVVVFKLKDLQQARSFSEVRGSVYQRRSDSTSDDLTLHHVLFNPISPFSPFYGCSGFCRPNHVCEVHADPHRNYISEPLGVERHIPPEIDRPAGVDHAPGTNPFESRPHHDGRPLSEILPPDGGTTFRSEANDSHGVAPDLSGGGTFASHSSPSISEVGAYR